jgi:hypothetical protein
MVEKNSDDVIFSELQRRLDDQLHSIQSLDTKAALTLTFVGAIIAGLVNSSWFLGSNNWCKFFILLSLAITAILALLAVIARGYRGDPNPNGLINGYAGKSERVTKGQLTRNYQSAFNDNAKIISRKYVVLNAAFIGLLVSVIVLAASILLVSSNNSKDNSNDAKHSTRSKLHPKPAGPESKRPNYQGS